MNFLEQLLGANGLGQMAPQQAPPPEPEPEQDMGVSTRQPYDFHGMFGARGGVRNILGVLGDAFLTQAGRPTVYAPRRQREREAEALHNLDNDPLGSIRRYTRENPSGGLDAFNDFQTQRRLGRTADQNYEGQVTDRALRMAATANEQNWPELRRQIMRYAETRNVQLPFELPEAYSPDAIEGLRRNAVPVTNQVDDEALANWRATQDANTDYRQEDLHDYRRESLGQRAIKDRAMIRQGDARITQGQERVDQGKVRLGQGIARLAQGDRALDQYDSGVRGNTRRPRPTNIRHRVLENGTVEVQRNVGGRWITVR